MTLVQPTPIMTMWGLFGMIRFTGFCVFFLDAAQKMAFGMPNTYAIKIPPRLTRIFELNTPFFKQNYGNSRIRHLCQS